MAWSMNMFGSGSGSVHLTTTNFATMERPTDEKDEQAN
jgi:hypothetical protein